MSDTINHKTIRDRIKQEAREIVTEYAPFPTENTLDSWDEYHDKLEELRDRETYHLAHESVGGWDWAIYTYKGFQVYDALSGREQCAAESMFEDVGGYETATEQRIGPYELGAAMAFWWLAQELANEIQSQCDELIELATNQSENLGQ